MKIYPTVQLTGEEAKAEFYGIIAEFYLAGSRPYKTFSAKRILLETFNENEIEELPKYADKCKVWYKSNPNRIEISMDDYLFYKKLAKYCHRCWVKEIH